MNIFFPNVNAILRDIPDTYAYERANVLVFRVVESLLIPLKIRQIRFGTVNYVNDNNI